MLAGLPVVCPTECQEHWADDMDAGEDGVKQLISSFQVGCEGAEGSLKPSAVWQVRRVISRKLTIFGTAGSLKPVSITFGKQNRSVHFYVLLA